MFFLKELTGFDCGGEGPLQIIKFFLMLLKYIFILVPVILTALFMMYALFRYFKVFKIMIKENKEFIN